MQVISKIEEPNTPPSLTHSSPPLTPTSPKELMHTITKLLEQGQESAQLLRSFLNKRLGFKVEDHDHDDLDLDHHSLVALNSFNDALSIAKSFHFDQEGVIIKRKLDRTDNIESLDHCKAEDSVKGRVHKERRGCYKRRRTGETKTFEVTELADDGYAWRKYGQKDILNTKFPRNYYRCTHKHDQDCQATKQVQQISENPTKYNIIYNGIHTCKNPNKNSSIIIDPQSNSTFILNFENNHTSLVMNGLNSSILFPTSSPTFLDIPTMVKQEELPISPSAPHDLDHVAHINQLYPSSSSCDVTSTTPVSDQGDSNEYRSQSYDDYDDVFLNLMDIL